MREACVKQNYGDSFSLKLFIVSLPMKKRLFIRNYKENLVKLFHKVVSVAFEESRVQKPGNSACCYQASEFCS